MGRILVIDDEEILRVRLRDLLILDDHQAFAAGSGEEGLEVLAKENPDIVIVDLKMPGMDGLEVLRKVKQASAHTEVILLTGHGGVETAIEAMRQGAFSYLQKPLEYDELTIEIKRIYEKFALNEKVEKYVHDLETAVRERDMELQNRRKAEEDLREANRIAEAANKAKSMFLAHMSHEIRTPLHGIIGFCELLKETSLSADQRNYLDPLHSCGSALLTIVNDILDFSKIEANKIDLENIKFDLGRILGDFKNVFSMRASKKNVALTIDVEPNVPLLLIGDSGRLRQVISNLMGNAIKFTEKGSVSLTVELEEMKDVLVALRFTIRDTGVGIPPEYISTLFSPFEQGDKSTTRKFGGTGLGLVISKELVEKMGGRIGVESAVGQGSTFWFTVQLAQQPIIQKRPDAITAEARGKKAEVDQIDTSEKVVPASALSGSQKAGFRILVAEDNLDNQTLVTAFLKKLGYGPPILVATGAEAVKALREVKYDVVLMDCQMPEMDGFTATRHIRDAANKVLDPNVPIIAMTASASKEDREACLNAGMNEYLSKPVSSKLLGKVLEQWLGAKGKAEG